MKIKDVMARDVDACNAEATLAEAGWKMWDRDCGLLPVLADGRVVGVITDRDIAIAAATKAYPAREIAVRDVMNGKVHACHPEEDIEAALEVMAQEQIRRIPVVDAQDRLQGILSINDLILRAEDMRGRNGSGLTYEDVMVTLKEISRHRQEGESRTGVREGTPPQRIPVRETPSGRR